MQKYVPLSPEERAAFDAQCAQLYRDGLSVAKISAQLGGGPAGASTQRVASALARAGVTMRPRGWQPKPVAK